MTKETYLKIKEEFKNKIKTDRWVPGYMHAAYWCVKHRVDLEEISSSLTNSDPIDKWLEVIPSIKLHISERDYNHSLFEKIIDTYMDWLTDYEGSKDRRDSIKRFENLPKEKSLLTRIKEKLIG